MNIVYDLGYTFSTDYWNQRFDNIQNVVHQFGKECTAKIALKKTSQRALTKENQFMVWEGEK